MGGALEKGGTVSSLTSKLIRVMDRVEYRRIVNAEDMEDVARLRHKAYTRHGILDIDGDLLVDELDFDSHAYVFGVYFEEALISTVRIQHVTPAHRQNSAGKIFPEVVNSMLDAGMTLIDPSRLAADPEIFEEIPGMPYLAQRIVTMASDYFQVDRCLQLIRRQHYAFYRRVFDSREIVTPKHNVGGYNFDVTLLAAEVPAVLPRLYTRYPFFRSQPFERRMMFAPTEQFGTLPLTIRPTARYLQTA